MVYRPTYDYGKGEESDYAVFLGRFSPEKRPTDAEQYTPGKYENKDRHKVDKADVR